MKRFLKKRWHSIPVTLVSALLVLALVAGSALAAVLIQQDQHITQIIELNYGTITAPAAELPNVKVGDSFTVTCDDVVTVDLGPSGVGKMFSMTADASDLYTSFGVTLELTDKPDGSGLVIGTKYTIIGGGETGLTLDAEGIYTFEQTIKGTAGSTAGTADSIVTFVLEEGPPPHP